MSEPLSIIADSLRLSGDLEGALQTIREARSGLDPSVIASETSRRTTVFNVLWREGTILGQEGDISLNRPAEAVETLQKAFDLTEEWVQKDADNFSSRILLASAAREMGKILAHRDPQRAMAIYEKAASAQAGAEQFERAARRGAAAGRFVACVAAFGTWWRGQEQNRRGVPAAGTSERLSG